MVGVALLCACHKSENEQIFDKLDRVIAKKHLYEERFVRHADSLRRELRAAGDDTLRWQTANRLFDSYITYNIDTAARYVGLMHNYADATGSREMKFLSTTCDVSVLIARNNIEEAYERILSLDTVGITRRMRASYYTQQMVVFGRLASGDGLYLPHQAAQFGPRFTQRFRDPDQAYRPLTGRWRVPEGLLRAFSPAFTEPLPSF